MMKQQKLRVALILPAYNEAAVVGDVIKNLHKVFASSAYDASIILVDDGSVDGTARVAEQAGANVIRHILNTGSGGATATGLAYAREQGFTLAATLDADGQHDPHDVLKGLDEQLSTSADLLIGSRLMGDSTEHMSLVRRFLNRSASLVTFVLFGVNVTDSQSGLRIFSKNALENLRWRTTGYEFCSEMLWRARQANLVVTEYPIKTIYTDHSISKPNGQSSWNAFNIVKTLIRQRIVELFSE